MERKTGLFVCVSGVVSVLIVFFSMLAGAIHYIINVPEGAPDDFNVLRSSITTGFITYILLIALLKGAFYPRGRPRLAFVLIFFGIPLGVFNWWASIGIIPSIGILALVAGLAMYQALVVRNQQEQERVSPKKQRP